MEVKRVLVPVKGEKADEEAVKLACDLVRPLHGKLYTLYIIEVPREYPVDAELPDETARAEAVLRRMESLGREQKCEVLAQLLQARDAGPALVREAVEREVHLILLAMPYKRQYGVFSLGQTVPYILQHAPCPVVIVREAPGEPAGVAAAPESVAQAEERR
ncbi:MAG: universal stress protein [Chloroflexi bacterium]|nr:universal stress protein [Chloroflexota bacterium]